MLGWSLPALVRSDESSMLEELFAAFVLHLVGLNRGVMLHFHLTCFLHCDMLQDPRFLGPLRDLATIDSKSYRRHGQQENTQGSVHQGRRRQRKRLD
mmetsp:Transcript_599/g.1009  ORF Transcript_599/g.1009 Transcript_599/m.1009 type:complete len:97 (+) Transcript_599:77-367(+)